MRRVGDFQARLLFGVLYFTVVAPFGLAVRILADPLRVRRPHRSNWTSGKPWSEGIDALRRQY